MSSNDWRLFMASVDLASGGYFFTCLFIGAALELLGGDFAYISGQGGARPFRVFFGD